MTDKNPGENEEPAETSDAKAKDKSAGAKVIPNGELAGDDTSNYKFLDEHVEYREAIGLWKQWAQFRRQGLVFVTAAEAGVIAANSANIALSNVPPWALPAMGMLFAAVGFLNEVFLFNEMMSFKRRALELEKDCGYRMISGHKTSVHPVWLFLTQSIFRFYYLVWFCAFLAQLYIVLGDTACG